MKKDLYSLLISMKHTEECTGWYPIAKFLRKHPGMIKVLHKNKLNKIRF
jgi:hypothetical protein